jgi:hypothetical protein
MKLPVVLPPKKSGCLVSFSPHHSTRKATKEESNGKMVVAMMRAEPHDDGDAASTLTACCCQHAAAGDGREHNNALLLEQTEDEIQALLHTELSYRTAGQQQQRHRGRPPSEWRRKIGQWAYRVIDHFGV